MSNIVYADWIFYNRNKKEKLILRTCRKKEVSSLIYISYGLYPQRGRDPLLFDNFTAPFRSYTGTDG